MSEAEAVSFAATPGDLRQIILDYLCDNCYADTAQVLARDSSIRELDRDGDEVLSDGEHGVLDPMVVRAVQLRKDIKTCLLAGRIEYATNILNLHFPTVLSPKTETLRYDSSHLFLNLRIQNFIEQARTIALPFPTDMLPKSLTPIQSASSTKRIDPDEIHSTPNNSPEDKERMNRLLSLMRELYILTHALPVLEDRVTYINELTAVGGLLAYPIPEKSREMRKYLDLSRREAVADQINEAILCRTEIDQPSVIERIVRHTTILFSTLNSLKHPLPSPDQRPPGTEPFLWGTTASPRDSVNDVKTTKEKDTYQFVPEFELERLLGSDT